MMYRMELTLNPYTVVDVTGDAIGEKAATWTSDIPFMTDPAVLD